MRSFLDKVSLHVGDCRMVLRTLKAKSVDAVVCDPPYHLASIVERFGASDAAPAKSNGATGVYGRLSKDFQGQTWDDGDVAFRSSTWRTIAKVMKPGAHLVAFAATRNYHRMATAIEGAGFEVRDQLQWLYGSGMPKAHAMALMFERRLCDNIASVWRYKDDGQEMARAAPFRSPEANQWVAWATALKPAAEPIVLARKPLAAPTIADNVQKWGTGALNIDGCRIGNEARWPANVIHDGSLPGEAAGFFYSAKADADDRLGSSHPTVKPVDLMRWLVRLVTPPGGVVLDPFAGTGTTGEAAFYEGMRAILIEREAQYIPDIERRMNLALAGPDQRRWETLKATGKVAESAGPLFETMND